MHDQVALLITEPESLRVSSVFRMAGDPRSVDVLPVNRQQVFHARENEDIRFLRVEILRQTLLSLARDRWQRKALSEALAYLIRGVIRHELDLARKTSSKK